MALVGGGGGGGRLPSAIADDGDPDGWSFGNCSISSRRILGAKFCSVSTLLALPMSDFASDAASALRSDGWLDVIERDRSFFRKLSEAMSSLLKSFSEFVAVDSSFFGASLRSTSFSAVPPAAAFATAASFMFEFSFAHSEGLDERLDVVLCFLLENEVLLDMVRPSVLAVLTGEVISGLFGEAPWL